MPRRKNKKRGQRGKRRGRAAGIRATGSLPAASSPVDPSKLHTILRSVETLRLLAEKERQWKEARRGPNALSLLGIGAVATATNPLAHIEPAQEAKKPVETKTDKPLGLQEVKVAWSDVEDSDSDESPFIQSPVVELRALRGLFKADHPYRTRLSSQSTVTTAAGGVLNFQFACAGLGSTGEWATIDQLFDEFFLHEVKLVFRPANMHVTSGYATGATISAVQLQTTTATTVNKAFNAGLVMVSLFANAGYYASASAMTNNPSCAIKHSSQPWTYRWRNNVRFKSHDVTMSASSVIGWTGWTEVSQVSNYGGSIQIRTMADLPLGDQTNTYTLGQVAAIFDVSFRSRA